MKTKILLTVAALAAATMCPAADLRIGIIGLDTSHVSAFFKAIILLVYPKPSL